MYNTVVGKQTTIVLVLVTYGIIHMYLQTTIAVLQYYTSCSYSFSVFNIIIDRILMASGHGIKVVDGLNKTDKRSIFHFMYIVQLPYRKTFDTQMEIYTSMHNYDVSLTQYLQTHLSDAS